VTWIRNNGGESKGDKKRVPRPSGRKLVPLWRGQGNKSPCKNSTFEANTSGHLGRREIGKKNEPCQRGKTRPCPGKRPTGSKTIGEKRRTAGFLQNWRLQRFLKIHHPNRPRGKSKGMPKRNRSSPAGERKWVGERTPKKEKNTEKSGTPLKGFQRGG